MSSKAMLRPARSDSPRAVITFHAMGEPSCFVSSTCLSCGQVLVGVDQEKEICVHCGKPVDGSEPR